MTHSTNYMDIKKDVSTKHLDNCIDRKIEQI